VRNAFKSRSSEDIDSGLVGRLWDPLIISMRYQTRDAGHEDNAKLRDLGLHIIFSRLQRLGQELRRCGICYAGRRARQKSSLDMLPRVTDVMIAME
jgi:hypothetical protein